MLGRVINCPLTKRASFYRKCQWIDKQNPFLITMFRIYVWVQKYHMFNRFKSL